MCHHIFTPVPRKGEAKQPDRNCTRPLWRDGWCKMHHPEEVAKKMAEDEERQTRWRDEKERLYRNEFWKKNPEKLAMLNHFAGIALPLVMAMPDSKWHWDFSGHYGESTSVADEYALAAYSIAWAMLRAFEDVS